jgi:hypothetical protein
VDTGDGPTSLAVGDFNGDGKRDKRDLAVANRYSGTVTVLLGNGKGTLQAPLTLLVGDGSVALAVADFNRDGKPARQWTGGSARRLTARSA